MDQEALVSRIERLEQGAATRESRVASSEPPPPPTAAPPQKGEETAEEEVASRKSQVASSEPEPPPPESVSPPLGGSTGEAGEGGSSENAAEEPPPSPPSAAPPPPKGEETDLPPADVSLAEFQAAWPAIVASVRTQFGARRHAFVKVAEPLAVADGVATLGMPAHQHFHLEQLNADTELRVALDNIAAEQLGGSITLEFVADDGPTEPANAEPERAPDKDRLLDEGTPPDDPADLIADMLGGEVVSE